MLVAGPASQRTTMRSASGPLSMWGIPLDSHPSKSHFICPLAQADRDMVYTFRYQPSGKPLGPSTGRTDPHRSFVVPGAWLLSARATQGKAYGCLQPSAPWKSARTVARWQFLAVRFPQHGPCHFSHSQVHSLGNLLRQKNS